MMKDPCFPPSTSFPEHVFIAGIGGVGMSALAEWLHLQGIRVRGSDRDPSQDTLKPLIRAGVEVVPQDGHGPRRDEGFVYSTAIEKDNPDWVRAESLGLRFFHRTDIIAKKANALTVIALAGTAGKTTMAAMLGWILQESQVEPGVLIGGIIPAWADEGRLGAAKAGSSDLLILEADESDRSLLRFSPEWAVVSNITQDHFSFEESAVLFREFCNRVKRGLILGPGVFDILEAVESFSASSLDIIRLEDVPVGDGHILYQGEEIRLQIPGIHNAWNAYMSAVCAQQLGVSIHDILTSLRGFRGVHRRLESLGAYSGMHIFDDYAHNPAKMKAAIETLQNRYESLLILWRPHGFAALRNMFEPLSDLFASIGRDQDHVLILPVFYAGGTADASINSDTLVDAVRAKGQQRITWMADYSSVEQVLDETPSRYQAFLGMGARDPGLRRFLDGLVLR